MDLFAESLNDVNEHITNAFEAFWTQAGLEERGKRAQNPQYLSINPEGVLLREAQDIVEELRMMIRIYAQQLSAVGDFHKSLERWNKQRRKHNRKIENDTASDEEAESRDLEIIEEMMLQVTARKAEIEELAGAAERSCQSLQGLLSLKQQQASIVEAKAALERATHGLEQQEISIRLSKQSYEQGQSIMAFTIVTIIFN
ncbi:hypothetical protein Daus18300_013714 [Diaporthe australafricana]|uniref:Nuf2 DHR10-like domain-containing protein n=1 Tax=Diaporthe australafricana TaxID=127596 RepID=A0ABR3VXZ9_9PEZI